MHDNGRMTPDPMSTDPYLCLGVARDASQAEIKSAYRRLAQQLHPDRNASPLAADHFDNITRAYMKLQTGAEAAAPEVSQDMVMVLLAESEVGSVDRTFDITGVSHYGSSSAGASRGLLCLGENGIAFVRRADPEWLASNRKRAVLSFTPDQSPELSVPSLDGQLTLSGGSRSVTFRLDPGDESVLRHHFHEVVTSNDPTAQYFITEYAGLVENAPKRSNSKWIIVAVAILVVVAVLVAVILVTVNNASRTPSRAHAHHAEVRSAQDAGPQPDGGRGPT